MRVTRYDVIWDSSRYTLDKSLVNIKDKIRIEENGNTLLFYRVSDEKLVHHCQKASYKGENIVTVPSVADKAVALTTLKRMFGDNETVCAYIDGIDASCHRYKTTHYRWVIKLNKKCSLDELEEAMQHCIDVGNCCTNELAAYLVYRHGEAKVRSILGNYLFYQVRVRAKELAEVEDGKH